MTTSAELYTQSELNKKLIQEIADEIKTTAERLYQDINTSPHSIQPKVDYTESATWKKAQDILSTVPSTSVHKANDIVITEQFKSPRATSSDPFSKQGDILAKPISSHLLSPPGQNANKKFDDLIAKADLIISKSPRRYEINAAPFDNLNLKTLPKSPVVASAFAETYNSSAKPAHIRTVSSPHGDIKLGDLYSGIDVNKIKTEYQPIQITVTAPRDYKEEYKTSTNTLVSSHEYKSTPVYTDKLLTYETSIQKPFDLYSPIEPKKEVVYNIESSYKPENKYYDHQKLDVVISSIAKRKGMSPEALKSPPKSNLKIITESNNPSHYYSGQPSVPQYIERPVESITQSAQFNLGDYKSSSQPIQYESIYHSSKPAHLDYGIGTVPTKDKLRDPYELTLSKLVERATLESGYGSALIRDDYNSIRMDPIPKKKTLGYETRSPRSPERSIIERVEALENDLDSLIVEFKETGKYPQGLDRPVQGLTGYQGLYRGRYEEYGNEVETRHKSPYAAGNEGLVYNKDLDKRRLHQGQNYQGGVSVSNTERLGASPERYVVEDVGRREGNTWRDEDKYRVETNYANYERRDWSYNPTEHGEIREQDFRKPRDKRELSPETYRRAYEYEGDVNRYSPQGQGRYYSPQRSNIRSPKYTNKTEQVTPTRGDKRQDSGQKGTNKIEKVFIY